MRILWGKMLAEFTMCLGVAVLASYWPRQTIAVLVFLCFLERT